MTPVTGGPARFLFLLGAVFLAAGSVPAGRRAQVLVADGLSAVYPVEFPLALVGTDSVEIDGRRLGPDEYALDLERGLLLFRRRPPHRSVIRVSCATLPPAVPASFRRYRPVPAEPEAGAALEPVFAPVDTAPVALGDLAIGGSKTIGVTIGGPEGSGLNQATRLAVSGMVEGVRVDAELSDQSSPIPPEGTTLEIDELDLIRIDVAAKDWRGRFGDVEFRLPTAGFGTVERRVVGGLVSGELGPVGARLGYARPRGRYGRTVLAGMDGVQGPYQLGPGGGSAMLVPGSEAVHLDGRRLTRGWDEDYTVDYSTGELVFTGRHVITRFSRIEAGYQYVVEAWERSDVIGGVSFLPGGLRVAADYYGESDDPLRSSRYELSADEREYLAGIGADTARAWLEGGIRVGAGEGDYELENGRYRYVGEGQGDYRVLFTFVGDSSGEYVFDDSIAAHRYAGAGAGDYVAAYRVELPGRSELGRVEFDYRPGPFRLGLAGIGRRSLLNLFADGGAPEFGGAAAGWAGWTGERSELRYQGRAFLPGFVQPGGDSLVDVEYRWGGLEQERVRLVNELTGRQELRDWLEVGVDLGLLHTFDDSRLARCLGRIRAG
ncbi:MAG TPA: hypothetical protein ENN51_09705, partial [candidate division WOR-3 bacterium]|nr:hypothetical protein [candidate division WOR-3 bacterium]